MAEGSIIKREREEGIFILCFCDLWSNRKLLIKSKWGSKVPQNLPTALPISFLGPFGKTFTFYKRVFLYYVSSSIYLSIFTSININYNPTPLPLIYPFLHLFLFPVFPLSFLLMDNSSFHWISNMYQQHDFFHTI